MEIYMAVAYLIRKFEFQMVNTTEKDMVWEMTWLYRISTGSSRLWPNGVEIPIHVDERMAVAKSAKKPPSNPRYSISYYYRLHRDT